jgi:DNA repair protein RadC
MRFQRAEPLKLDGLAAAKAFFAGCFAESDPAREVLWVAHLDGSANCLDFCSFMGGPDVADLPLRSVISDVLSLGSSGILIAHNHPSGDPRPSQSDCVATRRLACAAQAIDCRLIDHLVFGGGECTSFRSLGLL